MRGLPHIIECARAQTLVNEEQERSKDAAKPRRGREARDRASQWRGCYAGRKRGSHGPGTGLQRESPLFSDAVGVAHLLDQGLVRQAAALLHSAVGVTPAMAGD